MLSHEDNSILFTPSRRFDLSMSKRTRKPKIFNEEEEELDKEEHNQAFLQHSSLKELMEDNISMGKLEETSIKGEDVKVLEGDKFEKEDKVLEMKISYLALVTKKENFVGKYMKVLKHLIKSKRDHVKKRAVLKLPVK